MPLAVQPSLTQMARMTVVFVSRMGLPNCGDAGVGSSQFRV